ncbi:hypothetical protein [Frankia sp. Cas4]|uniref:hypothetical protein n=1 Tax=Frankia sp. Cas4 TaxID=3073927 RepID=UPI002AD5299A|nr:hypothetical protein [Frankia sp. Cas4]
MYLADESPVKLITDGGWWRITHHPTTGIYTADAFPRTGNWFATNTSTNPNTAPNPLLRVHAVTAWQLEEKLGFALPAAAHEILRELAVAHQPYPDPTAASTDDPVVPVGLRPSRASRVDLAGERADTYGRLLHAAAPPRTWTDGRFQIDIVDAVPVRVADQTRYQLGYRIWHDQSIVIAADDITMPITGDPRTDDTLRAIVDLTIHAKYDDLTPRQRDILDEHGETLTAALDPPDAPYPTGSRVTIDAADGQAPTTGIITGTVTAPDGAIIDYLWRPDLAALPGHPWQAHPDRVMASPAHRVQATLAPADTGLTRPSRPAVLSFGARIRTIDDPAFTAGTILRAFRTDSADNPNNPDNATVYEIQPDDPDLPPARLPATDVIPIAGTAWPDLNSLLDARDRARIPLHDGEILTTIRESTNVAVGLSGPIAVYPLRRATSRDPVLDPAALDRDVAGYRTPPYGPRTGDSPVAIEPHGGITRIRDPRHGILDIPTDLFTTARTWPAPALAVAAAHRRPRYFLEGDESPITLAALVCAHSPDLLHHPDTPALNRPTPTTELDL